MAFEEALPSELMVLVDLLPPGGHAAGGAQEKLTTFAPPSTVSVRPWKMAELDMPVPLEGMAS